MKKIITIFCCMISMQFVSAQGTFTLQTTAIGDVNMVVTPTYDNLLRLMRMPKDMFLTTMANYNYKQYKPGENEYRAAGPDEIYSVTKDEKQVDIFFSADTGYPQAMKDDFLTRFPGARRRLMGDGIEAYYFDLRDSGGPLHYCMLFDITKGNGGGVTLLAVD